MSAVEDAIAVLAEFFPKSAPAADKQRFVLKRLLAGDVVDRCAPIPSHRPLIEIMEGEARDKALSEFLDQFYLAVTPEQKVAMLRDEPAPTGDARLEGLLGAVADISLISTNYLTSPGGHSRRRDISNMRGMRLHLLMMAHANT